MKSKNLENRQGEPLVDKEGNQMVEHKFEPGDEFIPKFNTVLERKNKAVLKGEEKTITNYSLKCDVREADGKQHSDVFVSLTPTQAKSLKKKIETGVELNQNMFVVYNYEHEEYGTCVGIGLKSERKDPKTFDDFKSE